MIHADMATVRATTLRRNTRAILKLAEDGPVIVTRYGRPTFVLLSAADFIRIGGHSDYVNLRLER